MPARIKPVKNDQSRVWLMEGGAGPFTTPTYEGLMKGGTPRYQKGQKTSVTNPSSDNLGDFDIVDSIAAARSNPQLPLTGRYTKELSKLLRITNQDCPNDIQVHIGTCQDPKDFTRGWDKILALEEATSDDWGTSGDIGALNESDRAVIDETSTFTGTRLYEIVGVGLAELAATVVETEVVGIVICDRAGCSGQCGSGSDGCQKVFAVEKSGGASPSSYPGLTFSEDGGASWDSTAITSMGASDVPSGVACVGRNIAVLDFTTPGLHYADIDDIIEGDETWAAVTSGFSKAPNAILSLGAGKVWIVAEDGYIFFSEDVTAGVTAQDEGNATTEDLRAIDGADDQNLVAVGENNAVVYTQNGGDSWSLATGPDTGVILLSVSARGEQEWLVGTAGGKLWATRNRGRTWTQIRFTADGTGEIRDIKFSTRMVGWMVHTIGGVGKLLRTIDGGRSWYVTPEGTGTMPTNQALNSIAVCTNANHVFAGGLGTSTDGFIVEAA